MHRRTGVSHLLNGSVLEVQNLPPASEPPKSLGQIAQRLSHAPNFVLLNASLPDVARLMAALVQARDAVEHRSWSHTHKSPQAKNGGPTCLPILALASA